MLELAPLLRSSSESLLYGLEPVFYTLYILLAAVYISVQPQLMILKYVPQEWVNGILESRLAIHR